MKFTKFIFYLLVFLILTILLGSCADSINVDPCLINEEPYGFLGGIWHGMIAPLSFFGSLISDDIAMYATNNNGGWYDFGFVIGAGILFGGGYSSK